MRKRMVWYQLQRYFLILNFIVCTEDNVCDPITFPVNNATCYNSIIPITENFALCNITSYFHLKSDTNIVKKIEDIGKRLPQISWSCNNKESLCNFQFWASEIESFYCSLSGCHSEFESSTNVSTIMCSTMSCRCYPGQLLCGQGLDLTEWMTSTDGPTVSYKKNLYYGNMSLLIIPNHLLKSKNRAPQP
jgi:hypothetical protein